MIGGQSVTMKEVATLAPVLFMGITIVFDRFLLF